VFATAGSLSAISALFGGPLVAGLLLLEAGSGLGAALIGTLLPGVVAAAVGYLIFVGLGDWGGLDETALVVPDLPAYQGTHLLDLLVGVLVGVATALLVAQIRRAARAVAEGGERRLGMSRLLLGGGLAVGLLALLADLLGADSRDVLFSGQSSIPTLVTEDSAGIVLLVLVLVAKALAFAVCLGCGFRGGPVFPAIFLGIALAMLAVILFDVSPTLAVAAGTAAGTAAMARLLFAALLFGALLVGSASLDVIPAAVLAAAAAWVTMTALERRRRSAAVTGEGARPGPG
jgi:H+/Cl- antiporter ClcA